MHFFKMPWLRNFELRLFLILGQFKIFGMWSYSSQIFLILLWLGITVTGLVLMVMSPWTFDSWPLFGVYWKDWDVLITATPPPLAKNDLHVSIRCTRHPVKLSLKMNQLETVTHMLRIPHCKLCLKNSLAWPKYN